VTEPRRPTSEVIVLMLAGAVAIVLVVAVVLVAVLELAQPGVDTSHAVAGLTSMTTVLMGVVVGFVAGRRTP